MRDNSRGKVCDAMVRSILGEELTVDFMRKVVFFLADQGWTFQRQESPQELSLFGLFFRDQARELKNGTTPRPSFKECLSFLRMLAKIGLREGDSNGAQCCHVAVIVSFLLEQLGSQTEQLSLPVFLEVVFSLKKIGEGWTIFFDRNGKSNGMGHCQCG